MIIQWDTNGYYLNTVIRSADSSLNQLDSLKYQLYNSHEQLIQEISQSTNCKFDDYYHSFYPQAYEPIKIDDGVKDITAEITAYFTRKDSTSTVKHFLHRLKRNENKMLDVWFFDW